MVSNSICNFQHK